MIDLSMAASAVTILGGAAYVGRSMLRAAGSVKENTVATKRLSEAFEEHRDDVVKTLTDHGERLARLEGRRSSAR